MAETFNNALVDLSTTSITDIYQAPTGNAADITVTLSCLVANVHATDNCDVTVTITDGSNTALGTIANAVEVPINSSLEIVTNKLVLKQSQKIRATASVASALNITVSALEITV